MTSNAIDRRTVLWGAAIVGAGAGLTACGDDETTEAAASPADPNATADSIGAVPDPTTPPADIHSLGAATAVPVGGGVIYKSQKVVVTQPTAGVFKAFSAVCTHQGCMVSEVNETDGKIICNCHGSSFSVKDGAVIDGPASAPLKEEPVSESGGTLKLG